MGKYVMVVVEVEAVVQNNKWIMSNRQYLLKQHYLLYCYLINAFLFINTINEMLSYTLARHIHAVGASRFIPKKNNNVPCN